MAPVRRGRTGAGESERGVATSTATHARRSARRAPVRRATATSGTRPRLSSRAPRPHRATPTGGPYAGRRRARTRGRRRWRTTPRPDLGADPRAPRPPGPSSGGRLRSTMGPPCAPAPRTPPTSLRLPPPRRRGGLGRPTRPAGDEGVDPRASGTRKRTVPQERAQRAQRWTRRRGRGGRRGSHGGQTGTPLHWPRRCRAGRVSVYYTVWASWGTRGRETDSRDRVPVTLWAFRHLGSTTARESP